MLTIDFMKSLEFQAVKTRFCLDFLDFLRFLKLKTMFLVAYLVVFLLENQLFFSVEYHCENLEFYNMLKMNKLKHCKIKGIQYSVN